MKVCPKTQQFCEVVSLETYLRLCETSMTKTFKEIVHKLKAVNYFRKRLHHRCFTGFNKNLYTPGKPQKIV